ncbi:MAG TPA: D-aminoacyl-tRNA deacylase [Bryobacteraceae bacterium]|nr:D-aminoacyl-tRNA deacylase [Bryobacteraceae bacterium]
MRVVIQRVSRARVVVNGHTTGEIASGLVVLLGVAKYDTQNDADYLAGKVTGLRIFPDDAGKMNRSVLETGGSLLIVSQFTLYGDCRRGRRPGFDLAAPADEAHALYDYFVLACRKRGAPVETGIFQASMAVELTNEGPVTIICDSEKGISQ